MKEQKLIEQLIKKLQAGEITPTEFDSLKNLVEKYPGYKEFLEIHRMLSDLQEEFTETSPERLSQIRSDVLQKIRKRTLQTRSYPLMDSIQSLKNFILRPEMAVAALTLIIGFLLGRITPEFKSRSSSNLMSQIYSFATQNKRLVDVKNSPYVYSNVSFEEVDSDQIAMSFDVTTHVDAVRAKNDPLVREVIAQALLNPTNTGNELKAISYSESILDEKIKEALIFSAQNAPILAVRIKAMSSLMEYETDPDIQNAFLDILQNEESVKMQLMALEYLKKTQVNKNTLRSVIDQMDRTKNAAVVFKAQKYFK
jgi:hypothetical protein